MADGKQWTTRNLSVNTVPSHCYDHTDLNCRQYGKLSIAIVEARNRWARPCVASVSDD
jgi:hypothetical protein